MFHQTKIDKNIKWRGKMCDYRESEKIEGKLDQLEKEIEVNQAVQDFADEKMQEQLDLLEEKVEELEEKFATAEVVQDFESKPQPQEEQPFEFYKKAHTNY